MASLRVELAAGVLDALEFAQPANGRWGKWIYTSLADVMNVKCE